MLRLLRNLVYTTLVSITYAALLPSPAQAALLPTVGAWVIDEKAAVEFFACSTFLCGRIAWLKTPRNAQGELKQDKLNPDPQLRARKLCGPTIIWNLQADGPGRWDGGWFYNPDDGATYNVSVERKADDRISARIYAGVSLLGTTKELHAVAPGETDGWC